MPRRLTSLVTVLALAGSPAAVSACIAACLQVTPAAAMTHDEGAAVDHREHASTPPQVATSGHAHHASSAAPAPAASAGDRSLPTTHLAAACGNCCPDGLISLVASPGVERTNAHASGASSVPTPTASFLLTASGLRANPLSPPVSPPSPARAPLVLRI